MCPKTFNSLVVADFPARVNFRRCFVQRNADHFFAWSVLFTDEARFGIDGIFSIVTDLLKALSYGARKPRC
jgi:hypothetical protein